MSLYEWRPDLSVGQEEIDDDHKEMFRLLHELETNEMSDRFLSSVIERLEGYTREHFRREEELMRRYDYPRLGQHMERHRLFVEWLHAVKNAYQRSAETPYEIGKMVNQFIGEWLVDHVQHEDMLYRDFIVERRARGTSG